MTKKSILFLNIFFLFNVIFNLYKYLIDQSYNYTKQSNYISYSYGFVRRGLWGEIIKIAHKFNINTFLFIEVFSIIVFLIIIYYFYRKLVKNGYTLNFLFLPFTVTYIFLCGFIDFKDYLLLIITIIVCKVLNYFDNKTISYALVNIFIMIGTLIHEMFFFLSVPFLLVYLSSVQSGKSSFVANAIKLGLVFIPIFITFFAVVYYHGNADIANHLFEESIQLIPEDTKDLYASGGILSLRGEATNQFGYVYKGLIWNGFSRGISYSLFIITLLYITLNFNLFKKEKNTTGKNKRLFLIFLFQLIAMLPIFIYAIDWCRFISLSLLSSLIFFFELRPSIHNVILKTQNYIFQKANNIFQKFIRDDINTFYIVNYFCIIPYLEFGNTPWQFSNTIFMLMNYITKIISIL